MATVNKRLEEIIKDLSPEDKARLVVEEPLRSEPLLSNIPSNKLLASKNQAERKRFHAFLRQVDTTTDCVLRPMVILGQTIEEALLERDRVLWYLRGLEEVAQEVALSPIARFVDDPKPGKPIEAAVPFAKLHLGVWYRGRLQMSDEHGVELGEGIESLWTFKLSDYRNWPVR